ncbi:hypothetical protein F3Y22_tig00001644pilonHSYRG00387 [Hibiscus syriacus]|uniref:PGR5-like protein 1A n=1 Tax=Hibiscus syriacus TaxID=106335 RepID=A0A6A3CUS3_HIBSY|nr:hypothetical protein F3Y22_tig00001644pilonHSYRG00387 [Hibiscus syriacus]
MCHSIRPRSSEGFTAAKEEGPSCLFVGPIETASQETLEALYRQARDAYYSGHPLIVDDMFDRVELFLDVGQEDLSQSLTLASIWILIFAFGCTLCLVPIIYTISLAYQDPFSSDVPYDIQAANLEFLSTVNGILPMGIGFVTGYALASSAVRVLQRLWRNDLVALKGGCPNCGEEVFAFVKSEKFNGSPQRAECHVCDSTLEFGAKTEQSVSRHGRKWLYGRIYRLSRRGRSRRWM